jgi:hypothetical protein
MNWRVLFVVLLGTPVAQAGVYYSGDEPNPLPVVWRGFLLDLRALRVSANPSVGGTKSSTPLRDRYVEATLKLEAKVKTGLTADERADLGALYIRLGQPEKAVAVLRPGMRDHPDHFRIAANLGTACQLIGDWDQSITCLSEAVRLAPENAKKAEELHLKLVRLRSKDNKGAEHLDDLFGAKYPDDALALGQQLCVWLPNDSRLMWQLGEIAHSLGDLRSAANLLDGCVTEMGLASATARERRKRFREEVEAWEKQPDHQPFRGISFASQRVFPKRFDASWLPKIHPSMPNPLPWGALDETEIGKKFAVRFLPYVDELDGKTVQISGYMIPSKTDTVTEFLISEFPIGCWFCESPGPLQLLRVESADGKPISTTTGLVTITGTLRLNRTDPEQHVFSVTGATVRGAE